MKRLLLFLLLVPTLTFAQVLESPGGITLWTESSGTLTWTGPIVGESFTSTAASGQVAVSGVNGSKFCPGADTACFTSDGSNLSFGGNFYANVGSFSSQTLTGHVNANTVRLMLRSGETDGASAYAFDLYTGSALSTAGAVHTQFRNDATVIASIDKDGAYGMDGTDESGTPGAATINKAAGRVAIVAAASTVVVTNSIVTADSIIVPVPEAVDATCTAFAITPAAGSFTISSTTGVCTATMPVSFVVHPMF